MTSSQNNNWNYLLLHCHSSNLIAIFVYFLWSNPHSAIKSYDWILLLLHLVVYMIRLLVLLWSIVFKQDDLFLSHHFCRNQLRQVPLHAFVSALQKVWIFCPLLASLTAIVYCFFLFGFHIIFWLTSLHDLFFRFLIVSWSIHH